MKCPSFKTKLTPQQLKRRIATTNRVWPTCKKHGCDLEIGILKGAISSDYPTVFNCPLRNRGASTESQHWDFPEVIQ